jgi:3-hydroxyisobutyrate dehydrogenase
MVRVLRDTGDGKREVVFDFGANPYPDGMIVEGLAILVKAGVDPKVALDVINASSGRSNSSENLIPQRVLTRAFPRTFRLALLEKDIGIAALLAEDLDARTPLISLTAERFHEAREKLGETADHVEAVKMVEEENGVEIK